MPFGLVLATGTPVNFGLPLLSRSGLGQGSRFPGIHIPLSVPVGEISLTEFSGVHAAFKKSKGLVWGYTLGNKRLPFSRGFCPEDKVTKMNLNIEVPAHGGAIAAGNLLKVYDQKKGKALLSMP